MSPSVCSMEVEGSPKKVMVGDGEVPLPFFDEWGTGWLGMEPIVIGMYTRKLTVPRNKRVNWREEQSALILNF